MKTKYARRRAYWKMYDICECYKHTHRWNRCGLCYLMAFALSTTHRYSLTSFPELLQACEEKERPHEKRGYWYDREAKGYTKRQKLLLRAIALTY